MSYELKGKPKQLKSLKMESENMKGILELKPWAYHVEDDDFSLNL